MTYILGLNCVYHDSSACLLKQGKIVAYAEEERFNRIKHAKYSSPANTHILPVKAINHCLALAGISGNEIDTVSISFLPEKRKSNLDIDTYQVEGKGYGSVSGELLMQSALSEMPQQILDFLGNSAANIEWLDHHICHAYSALAVSPWSESAVMVIDGIAEFDTVFLGYGDATGVEKVGTLSYPDSLGFLWEKLAVFLGFSKYDAGKIMGLAAYGEAEIYEDAFKKFVEYRANYFSIDNNELKIRSDDFTNLEKIFGIECRKNCEALLPRHADIAAGLQSITNDVVCALAGSLYERSPVKTDKLCYAGGVALNCKANAELAEKGPFKNIFIPPHCNDAGTSIGAAYAVEYRNSYPSKEDTFFSPYWPGVSNKSGTYAEIEASGFSFQQYDDINTKASVLLASGEIIARYSGTSEIGPRALGNRSILAPADRFMVKDVLNFKYKQREFFRPVAPVVLAEYLDEYFELPFNFSPSLYYMLYSLKVRKEKINMIPGAVHMDGSARVQVVDEQSNLELYKLLKSYYEQTGIPVLINTSFNYQEPIVYSIDDALNTFDRIKDLKYMVVDNYLLYKVAEAEV